MTQTLKLDGATARKNYPTASPELKVILEESFGKDFFTMRPLGVWILTTDGKAVKPEDWEHYIAASKSWSGRDIHPLGVGLVTESAAIQIHPGPSAVLHFGSPTIKEYPDVCFDEQTLDSAAATTEIIAAHDGVLCKYNDSEIFDFTGAPAAAWCRSHTGGILSSGLWSLPTLAALKLIQYSAKDINAAMKCVGGYILTPGCYWTSTVTKSGYAYVVYMFSGYVGNDYKDDYDYVRAVSAFQIEDFEFLNF